VPRQGGGGHDPLPPTRSPHTPSPFRAVAPTTSAPLSIMPQALRQFVIDYVERMDFRRVDKFALVRLLITL
jgi:hypothetical protein